MLRSALDGDGPAILPYAAGAMPVELPASVDREVAVVVETSGSTAAPKRVCLSGDALRASAQATAARIGEGGQWLLALPAHYVAGVQVLLRSLLAGTEPVVASGHFDVPRFIDATERMRAGGPRYTSLVPVQLARLVEAAEQDRVVRDTLASFDRILLGGQAAPTALLDDAARLGARVTVTYGSSETSGGCVYDGRPLDGVHVRIIDGRIELGGAVLAQGYLGDSARTTADFTVDADGVRWYRTSDLGSLDSEGRLTVLGRADDVIISGGIKVALGAVERIVREQPGFTHAVALGVAHPEWGQAVAIAAPDTRAANMPDALDMLGRAVASAIGPAGRPTRLLVVPELPLLPSGKPDRRALAEVVLRSAGPSADGTAL